MRASDITDDTPVIMCRGYSADTTTPIIYNFYTSTELAEDFLTTNAEKFAKDYPNGSFVTTYGAFKAEERKAVMTGEIQEITREKWWEMLEILPPRAWQNADGVERFYMSEFLTSTYTSQYARLGERYFHKIIDAADKTTWLTADEIRKAFP